MNRLYKMTIPTFVLPFLLALVLLGVTGLPAAAKSSSGVNSQDGYVTLSPNQTFCLPTQKVAGINGGKVAAGGFSFKDHSGSPFATLWTVYNGSSSRTLHAIGGSTTSYFHEVDTVPVGSFYKACITDSTSFNIVAQIAQTEFNVH